MPEELLLDAFEQIGWIMLWAFGLVVLIQLVYYWAIFSRLSFYKRKNTSENYPPVSVIVCGRNEYENFETNLPLIFNQDYPEFEVVVVNDGSDDDSFFLLHEMKAKEPRLKVINLQKKLNFFSGKKFPLAVGIRCSKYPLIVLTDADCSPKSGHWLKEMVAGFDPQTEIVLGYAPLSKKPGLLNKLIRYDTFFVALQYLSFALAKLPYMGVGRNLSYTKDLFFRNKGFTSHYQIPTGDDDLFVNMVAKGKNTRICIQPDTWMTSEPKDSFLKWFMQKKRHMIAGNFYNGRTKFLLGLFGLSQLAFYVLFILLMVFANLSTVGYIALGLFGLRTVSMMIVFSLAGKKLGQGRLALFSPLLDAIALALSALFAVSTLFSPKTSWK